MPDHNNNHLHMNEDDSDRKPNKYIVMAILAISILGLFLVAPKSLNKDIFRGKIIQIKEERIEDSVAGIKIKVQDLLVAITIDGEKKEFSVINDFTPVKVGDKVFMKSSLFGDDQTFEIIDLSREKGIIILTALFIFLVIITAGWKGFYSLIGLIFSLAVIIAFIVPMILKGYNPVTVGITGSILILLGTLYLSYGLHKKSISALIGITATLLFVGLLSNFTVQILRFTGFANEGALFLNMEAGNPINVVGLLMAGIIIAAIGVLDDVAVTQASTVFNISSINPSLSKINLFKKAMIVGKDHISAVINTLVLAYVGASLPLILLLSLRNMPIDYFVSFEMVSEEIVRTLIASSGLLLAVPLTTAIAVFFCKYKYKNRGLKNKILT